MLVHEEVGRGARPIVFVHGLFARGSDLRALALAVTSGAPDVRALLPDLPGHGASPDLSPGADLASVASAITVWLDALGIGGRVPIVAHSMGGRVALRAMQLAPARFGPLACIDTPPGNLQQRRSPLEPFIKAMLAAPERADDPEPMLAPFRKILLSKKLLMWTSTQIAPHPDGGYGWSFDRHAMAEYRWRSMGEDLWPIVASLSPDAMAVVAPERSVYVRKEDRERYATHGIEVAVEPKGTHDMHHKMPADKLARIRRAIGLQP